MTLIWKGPALNDLIEIRDYIAQDNPSAALSVAMSLRESADILRANPYCGRAGTLNLTRELVIAKLPYILVYQLVAEDIEILRVVHTSRLWPETRPLI